MGLFSLPTNEFRCKCGGEWFAEYDNGDTITCPSCKGTEHIEWDKSSHRTEWVKADRYFKERFGVR